uniref:Reverse transcriptase domain-containing protein n=1 Tax=Tetraodon nigroviridis TaxID=99883 RepID=H3BW47_TETNG
PVALLCTDDKVLSRALSNRLKESLSFIVHSDQTYCIPDRSIMDNISLIRDLIDVCRADMDYHFGIVCLDQEKAFDRVDHSYLFSTLRAFGFGDGFIAWVSLLYRGAQCLVKTGAGLSRPIAVQRGIRQGCPISGQLYSLAIEPLLCRLRNRLSGLPLPGASDLVPPPIVSAYADDVSLFVTSQRDVDCLQDTLALYEKASSARVNWAKSEALLVGQWRGQVVPSLPGGLEWSKDGLKILGVFLGTEKYQLKNWEGVRETVRAKLSKWERLLPQLSYRGRVLVANLAASTLWHRLNVLTPPKSLIEDIQRDIVDFFWAGKHWVRAAVLYLPGLVNIQARIAASRLQTAQRILYTSGPGWIETARLLLRRAGRLGYDKQLFLLQPENVCQGGLAPFYSSVLQAWRTFRFTRTTEETAGMWVFEEPLFFNSFLRSHLRARLRAAGCTKLGHLMAPSCLENLRMRSNITSARLFNRVVEEVSGALPQNLRQFAGDAFLWAQWADHGEYSFPSLLISPQLLSFTTPHLGKFKDLKKKSIYQACVKVLDLQSLAGLKESRWAEVHRAHMDPGVGEECLFCGETETLAHLFVRCSRLSGLFELLKGFFHGFGEVFSFDLFVFGPQYCSRKRYVHTLINFLTANAKLAIWLTCKNKAQGAGSVEPAAALKGLLKARLRVEHTYHKMTSNMLTFIQIWAVGRVLCSVGEQEELMINY